VQFDNVPAANGSAKGKLSADMVIVTASVRIAILMDADIVCFHRNARSLSLYSRIMPVAHVTAPAL